MDEYVSVSVAGKRTGIAERTLRNWITRGTLPAMPSAEGKLVRLGDVQRIVAMRQPTLAEAAPAGNGAGHEAVPMVAPGAQLAAVMDEWLAPLVDRLNAQAERLGVQSERIATLERETIRLQRERETLAQERDRLQQQLAAITASAEPASMPAHAPDTNGSHAAAPLVPRTP